MAMMDSPSVPTLNLLSRAPGLYKKRTFFASVENLRRKATLPPISLTNRDYEKFDIPKPIVSTKSYENIEVYAGCTFAGTREVNEDRVVMLTTKLKNSSKTCSYFAIFDGFSGIQTCNYLRDNLHKNILQSPEMLKNPVKAILDGFALTEKRILKSGGKNHDNSGSCALVVLILNEIIYVANLGTSRCILSSLKGFEKTLITNEHNVGNLDEVERIGKLGSSVETIEGSKRLVPGNILVTRCFGCYKTKLENSAIVAVPEIRSTKMKADMDCLVLMSDGIWEVVNKHEISNVIWKIMDRMEGGLMEKVSRVVTQIIKSALDRKSSDNVSVIIIGLNRFIN